MLPVELLDIIFLNCNNRDIDNWKSCVSDHVIKNQYRDLEEAAERGNLMCVEHLYDEYKGNIQSAFDKGCSNGHLEIANFFISKDIHRKLKLDYILATVCIFRYKEIAKFLISNGASLHNAFKAYLTLDYHNGMHIVKDYERWIVSRDIIFE